MYETTHGLGSYIRVLADGMTLLIVWNLALKYSNSLLRIILGNSYITVFVGKAANTSNQTERQGVYDYKLLFNRG